MLLLFFLSGYTTMFLTFGGKPSATDKCLALGTDAGPLVNTFNSYFGRFADRCVAGRGARRGACGRGPVGDAARGPFCRAGCGSCPRTCRR